MKEISFLPFFVVLCLIFSGCSEMDTPVIATQDYSSVSEASISASLPEEDLEKVIYADDETIQSFLTKYNTLYPNEEITPAMITKDYHHGTTHDDQVVLSNEDFSLTISSTYVSGGDDGISVFIDNVKKLPSDTCKNAVFHFLQVYGSEITEADFDAYWSELTDTSYSSLEKYEGIEFNLSYGLNGVIGYVKITGPVQ
ncbi:MAG: hypothetical protein IJB75_05145 [Oscillospiraceae bacterium]|nr:hypothetical protein [Oscillospiraceae bacterium]